MQSIFLGEKEAVDDEEDEEDEDDDDDGDFDSEPWEALSDASLCRDQPSQTIEKDLLMVSRFFLFFSLPLSIHFLE